METAVVVPSYNERETIRDLLQELRQFVPESLICIVDDASPDGTGEIVQEASQADPNILLIRRSGRQGYGTALIAGVDAVIQRGAQRIVTMDADLSHLPSEVPLLIAATESAAVALGSRYVGGIRVLNWPLRRLMLSTLANSYVRTILRLPYHDLTSGFRCYRAEVLEAIGFRKIRSRGYAFLVEALYRCHRHGCRIVEVPITFYERQGGQSKLSKSVMLEAALLPWRLRNPFRPWGKRLGSPSGSAFGDPLAASSAGDQGNTCNGC